MLYKIMIVSSPWRSIQTGPDDSVWEKRGGERSGEGPGAQGPGGSRDTMDTSQPGGSYIQKWAATLEM